MNHHQMLEHCGGAALIVGSRAYDRRVQNTLQSRMEEFQAAVQTLAKAGTVTVAEACENIASWQAGRKKYSGVI